MRPTTAVLVGLIALAPWASAAQDAPDPAKDFPNRAIHIVVPFPAGGPADLVARIIGQKMSEDWGQPVVIDNRPGGNTVIGAVTVVRAPADGYTLLMAIDSTLVMNQFVYKNLPYDPLTDFAPITSTTRTISLLAVRTEDGPKDVKDLIAKAKATPGRLSYGAGTVTSQLMGWRFHKAAGIDVLYVPFKGTPATVNGLLTKSVDLIYAANVIVNPLVASGQLRALAKMDSKPAPAAADVPSLAEAAGLPNLEDMSIWLGLVAPKDTPRPIVLKLQKKIVEILSDPQVAERSGRTGAYAMTSTPEEFGEFIRQEADRWAPVLRETGIKFD
jgi:tripartite-type tricarboxylate transporter receptor subunit TctC